MDVGTRKVAESEFRDVSRSQLHFDVARLDMRESPFEVRKVKEK